MAQYRFDSWTTDDGLPQNSVLSVTQTRDGYLWLTTFDGLVRFDGVKFAVFDKSNTKGIVSNRFTCLFEDADGAVWAGSEYGGLTRYANGKFETFTVGETLANIIRDIQRNERGELIILTDGGVFKRRGDGGFERYPDEVSPRFQKIYWGQTGARWILDGRGLHRVKDNQITDYPIFVRETFLSNFYEDRDGALWFGAGVADVYELKDGVITVYNETGQRAETGAVRLDQINYVAAEDGEGNIWTGGPSPAILNRRDKIVRRLANADGFPSNGVKAIFSDREGSVWLGAEDRGLVRASRKFITTISKADGLNNDNVYPVLEDAEGDVWIGAEYLNRFSNGVLTKYDFLSRSPLSIYEDRAGGLWVGYQVGVGRLKDGQFTDFSETLGRRGYYVIKEDRAGFLWFGSDDGLTKFRDGNVVRSFNQADGSLPNDEIKDIYEDPNGALWIATYGGLVKIEDEKFTHFTEKDGLVSNRVRTIMGEADGTLWLGTYDGGLSRLKNGKFTNYTTADGLFNNGVFRILEDGRGKFWMSSNRGIYTVVKQDLNDLADGKITKITSTAYGKQDGMISTECNGGRQPAGFKSKRDGRLWFPTQQGVVVVDPEAVPFNFNAPPVVIESVKVDNQFSPDFESAIRNRTAAGTIERRD